MILKKIKCNNKFLVNKLKGLVFDINDEITRNILLSIPKIYINKFLLIPKLYSKREGIYYKNIFNHGFNRKTKKTNNKIELQSLKNIGVVNLSQGAGASFISMNFGLMLSEICNVNIIEHPCNAGYMYFYLGINSLCKEGFLEYVSIAHCIKGGEKNKVMPYIHGKYNIQWIINNPKEDDILSWNEYEMLKLLYYFGKTGINIIDVGNKVFHSSVVNIVEQFNIILVIVDPMIPNLLANYDTLKRIKKLSKDKHINLKFVVNKYKNQVDKELIADFLGEKPIAYVKFIDINYVYEAVFKGRIAYENREVKGVLDCEFKKIYKIVLNCMQNGL